MSDFQKLLKQWADKTAKAYVDLAKNGNDIAFYTQSDLTKLSIRPKIVIIGINPGSCGSYSDQKQNENWQLAGAEMDGAHLLRGNYCYDKKTGLTSWDRHTSWSYWRGLVECLSSLSGLDLQNESSFVLTNASFFNTKNAKDPDSLLEKTIGYTLELIDILQPEYTVFLSGIDCFNRISRLQGSGNFSFKRLDGTVVGRIVAGELNGRLVAGIPHPAYKTNEELHLVAKALPLLFKFRTLDEIDCQKLCKECEKELNAYNSRATSHKVCIDEEKLKQCLKDANLECREGKRFIITDEIQLTVANGIYVRHICFKGKGYKTYSDYELPRTVNYIKVLKGHGFRVDLKVWLGLKNYNQYGYSQDEIAKALISEIQQLQIEFSGIG